MAINLDRNLLAEIGLGSLPEDEQRSLLSHIYETLEMRVGMRLADQMSNEQLDEFERYFEAKDENGAFRWLETNFPNYKDIVQEEFNKLKEEVRASAPQILQASQSQAAAQTQPVSPAAPTTQQYQQPPTPVDPGFGPSPSPSMNPNPNPPMPAQPPMPPYQQPPEPPAQQQPPMAA
jgi:hypothetical protein